jgi:hypothetical protein
MRLSRFGFLAALGALVGCSSDSATDVDEDGIAAIITAVQTASGVTGTLKTGAIPPGSSGPALTAPGTLSSINGGTSAVQVSAGSAFQRLALAIEGVGGYYELFLPADVTSAQLFITLAQSVAEGTIPIRVAASDEGANYGPRANISATVTKVGAGDVQISLFWNTPSDVDLHVVGPSGEEIYYANRVSSTGGTLDLDSNADCQIDNINNENVTWPSGTSPSGTYRVLVDYWSSCDADETDYVVTINVAGRAPQVFQGTFTGDGDRGGQGDGRLITTFVK